MKKFIKTLLKNALISISLSLMLTSVASAVFLRNDNSSGGEDDYVYIEIGIMDYGNSDLRGDWECKNNIAIPALYGRKALATDMPYGVAIDFTQHPDQAVRHRLCMVVKYKTQYLKAAFDDADTCKVNFWFSKNKNAINEEKEEAMYKGYAMDISEGYGGGPNGPCKLEYNG